MAKAKLKPAEKTAKAVTREPIKGGESLTLADFLKRTNLGRTAWRSVRRKAATLNIELVTYIGRQGFVSTDKWLEYLERAGQTSRA